MINTDVKKVKHTLFLLRFCIGDTWFKRYIYNTIRSIGRKGLEKIIIEGKIDNIIASSFNWAEVGEPGYEWNEIDGVWRDKIDDIKKYIYKK